MPDIEVEDVPDEVIAVMQHRADRAGLTLEDYLRDWLVELAAEQP